MKSPSSCPLQWPAFVASEDCMHRIAAGGGWARFPKRRSDENKPVVPTHPSSAGSKTKARERQWILETL